MTNIDFIKQKRVGLTTFIHDQLIGPGAYGYKFGIDGENDKVDILDVTPGSIYCSGILFPKKKHGNDSGDSSKDDNTQAADALIKLVDRSDDDDDTLSISFNDIFPIQHNPISGMIPCSNFVSMWDMALSALNFIIGVDSGCTVKYCTAFFSYRAPDSFPDNFCHFLTAPIAHRTRRRV